MLSPVVRVRPGFRTPYPVKNAGVDRDTDPAVQTSPPVETDLDDRDKRQGIHVVQDGPGTVVQTTFHRASHLCLPGRHPSECVRMSGVELETEIYGAANSAVNVIVSPARPSCEPTGATLSSLVPRGPPRVTVRV